MSKLKLVKGASYSGYGVSVSAGNPYIEAGGDLADSLSATGYFEILETAPNENADAKKQTKQKKNHKAAEETDDGTALFYEDGP